MKVSVVTATHKRHDLLIRAIKSLEAQTFTDWEHIIVADGRDPELAAFLQRNVSEKYNYRLVELGRNWHTATGKVNYGGAPRLVGTYMASGDYIAYLDDDNEFMPNHLTDLVSKIEEGYDFVYGMAEIVRQDKSFERFLGDGELKFTNIDTSMVLHRWDLTIKENWNPSFDFGDDWDLFNRWLKNGAKVGFVPKVILRYYRNYIGLPPTDMAKYKAEALLDCGILTTADAKFFTGLQMLVYSIAGLTPVAVVDLGLTDLQKAWCHKHDVKVLEPPDDAYSLGVDWKYYCKPLLIRDSPFSNTLWLDADCILVGDPTPMFETIIKKPFVVEHWHAWAGYHPNSDVAYQHFPVKRFPISCNCGVLGFNPKRDHSFMKEWIDIVRKVCDKPELRQHVTFWDEGCLHIAAQKLNMPEIVERHRGWNQPLSLLMPWTTQSFGEFLEQLPVPAFDDIVYHCSGNPKFWELWK